VKILSNYAPKTILFPPLLDRSRDLASIWLDLVFVVLDTVLGHFTIIVKTYSESLLLFLGPGKCYFAWSTVGLASFFQAFTVSFLTAFKVFPNLPIAWIAMLKSDVSLPAHIIDKSHTYDCGSVIKIVLGLSSSRFRLILREPQRRLDKMRAR
jgi:hypothetical protein